MTDAQAIEAARRGERDAFALLVERYQRLVEAVAYSVTGQPSLVDDIVQDTFVTAWRTLDRLRDPACVRPWLSSIARNLARTARRRRQLDAPLPDIGGSQTPFDAVSRQEDEREVGAALAALPARYREPIVLFYYEHCTVKEVADALALREDAVMQRLSRGRRRLGEALATRVEIVLESRTSRAALVAGVLALLPTRTASAATVASAPTTATTTASSAAKVVWWRAVIAALGAHWRIPAAIVALSVAGVILLAAVERSNELAAKAEPPPDRTDAPAEPPPSPRPRLPDDLDGERVYRNIAIADLDPKVSCARGARGLFYMTLGRDALRVEGDQRYYEPTPAQEQTSRWIADRAAETCGGDRWPEIYVICEATLFDLVDGNVSCYPYDIFESDELADGRFADAGRRH